MMAKIMSRTISAIMSAALIFTSVPTVALAEPIEKSRASSEENLLKLWYDEPASQGVNILSAGSYNPSEEDNNWQQHTLPIGNSFMGANVYGEIAKERLTFNQKTLWNGGPSESRPDYDGGNIDKVSQWQESVNAFLAGDDAKGSQLAGGLVGEGEAAGYGVYQSWGDIYLDYKNLAGLTGAEDTTDYERNLDLTTGIANVDFAARGTDYHREFFVSYPDNVLAMKLTSAGADALDINVSFPIDNGEVGEMQGDITSIQDNKNKKLAKEEETYNVTAGTNEGTIVTSAKMQNNQMKMNSVLKVVTDKGTVAEGSDNSSLDIAGAEEIIIFISANTDYKNEYPKYRTGETAEQLAKRVKDTVDNAAAKGYDKVKSRYLADYQELFNRVDLDLGQAVSNKTTDQLLAAYKATGDDGATASERRLLEVLLYQYGRYLTIASSRDGDLPSTLQGVWQNRVGTSGRVPWGSDFHMNVNLQMNYWPTYSANLAECGIPIIDYVNSLREPGRVTAENYFGIKSEPGEANGFSAHTQNSPFGWTCPGWSFDWGWSPAAVPWIIQNCWEYYEYTGDKEYMRTHLYPMMKEETLLYDQILIDSGQEITLEDGSTSTRLVSAPAYSSEHGPRTLGNVYENVLVWQLYEDTITAAEVLGVDEDLVARWKETKERLAPIEVGDSGQIKEWYMEGEYGKQKDGTPIPGFQDGHRHMSHMLGLFPGDIVSVENEEYINAAIYTLERRGYNSTGWGMGQRINAWARTGKGNTAYLLVQNLFKGGIYPNLWDSHAPFQIDGNFGYTSGVNEMLMQSNVGYINILPALPDEWSTGSVNGIVARGNFELGIDWTEGKATEIRVLSKNGNKCIIQHPGIDKATITDSKGTAITYSKEDKANRISFNTTKGETYTITEIGEDVRLEAPVNTTAVKGDASGVELTWDAVTGADSYNVYAKEGKTTTKLNSTAVTSANFKDTAEYEDVTKVEYMVAAVKDNIEGDRSEKFSVISLVYPNKVEVVDETDSRVHYTGGWSSWSESGNYGGSIKFIETAVGDESVELQFYGSGIDLLARRKDGKYAAQWKVYIDGVEAGTADCAGSDTKQHTAFSKKDLSKGVHTIKLTTEGNAGKKIEVDAFIIYAEENAKATVTYDLGGAEGTAPAAQSGEVRSTIKLAACDVPGFQHWTDGSKTYQAGADYILSKDVTMTAVIDNETNTEVEYISISVPKSQWTATAGSEQGSGDDGPASWAIDGNEDTYWHSNYTDNSKKPTISENGVRNEFTIDFGEAVTIGKFEYVPRNNSNKNGNITGYQLLYSTDGDNFTEITKGTWADDISKKSVVFETPIEMQKIQIKATATVGDTANKFIRAAEFNVYQKNPDYDETAVPSGITVTSESLTLERGEIKDLGAKIIPDKARNKNMTFASSDLTVATVSPKGLVTASKYKSGTATITIKSVAVPTVTKTVDVTVNEPEEVPVESISLEKGRIVLRVGDTTSVAASITPYYGTNKTVNWSSSATDKVSVTGGTITAVAAGTAIITATTVNNKTATCEVVVTDQAETADRRELSSAVIKAKNKDLSIYTEESVNAYKEALKEAEDVLAFGTSALQTEIDAALRKLQEAEDGLEVKEGKPVDKTELQTSLNAFKDKYKDLEQYSDLVKQKFDDAVTAVEEVLNKDNPTMREINAALGKLTATDTALTAQIEQETAAGKPAFKNEIEAFKKKYPDLSKYSESVQQAFNDAVTAAENVLNNPEADKDAIDAALADLKKAGEELDAKIKEEDEEQPAAPNRTVLKNELDAAKKKSLTAYTPNSVTAYRKAIIDAQRVYDNASATQTQINTAAQALRNAASKLVRKADFTKLNAAITAAGKINLAEYTQATVNVFRLKLNAAKTVLNNQNATQVQVNQALANLQAAQKALQKAIPTTIETTDIVYNVTNSSATNGTVSVSGLTSAGAKKSTITIPPTVVENGYTFKVTAIDKNVFAKNKKLKKVIIGENVTNIESKSFEKCSRLATIQFKSTKAPKVGKQAFKGIKSKVKVFYSKKMKKKELNKLKTAFKKSKVKKVTYKKK